MACADFSRSTVSPIMMGAKTDFVKNLFKRKEDKQVTDFRSQLAGMDSLSGLSDLKLEREEKVGRTAGVWKEDIKADGRVWCVHCPVPPDRMRVRTPPP